MDLETENRIAAILMKEAAELRRQAQQEGVLSYLRKPTVRGRPNSRFLTATVLGVQQANKAVEVNEMWRAREKEMELDNRLKGCTSDDIRNGRNPHDKYASTSGSVDERLSARNDNRDASCLSKRDRHESLEVSVDEGLKDEEIEEFLHARVKRGRGLVGSRMDETGPYLPSREDIEEQFSLNSEVLAHRPLHGPKRPLELQTHESSEEEKSEDRKKRMKKDLPKSSRKKHSHKHSSKRKKYRLRGAFYLTDNETVDYFWMVLFVPSAIVFAISSVYLIAGMLVAYSAPTRHGCLKVVENNFCASRRGGVRCLAILNTIFSIVFGLLALFLGSTLLTLGSNCAIPLFWCYELASWGLVILYAGTSFFLRRKAAAILDEGEFSTRNIGLEMLETNPLEITPDVERRVNDGFKSWMGSSFLSSDEEEEEEDYPESYTEVPQHGLP